VAYDRILKTVAQTLALGRGGGGARLSAVEMARRPAASTWTWRRAGGVCTGARILVRIARDERGGGRLRGRGSRD
jgi:hypothetical protein